MLDHLGALVTSQLRKVSSTLNAACILSYESIDGTLQETDTLPSIDVEATARQAFVTPPRNRLRGHVEHPGEIIDRQHSFVDGLYKPGVEEMGS
jgi:hypothetical protein